MTPEPTFAANDAAELRRIAEQVDGAHDPRFMPTWPSFLRRVADELETTPAPSEDTGAAPEYPPAERLVESLRWAISYIDGLKSFDPKEKPYNGGDEEHDWMEWASAHDWLKDAAIATQSSEPSSTAGGELTERIAAVIDRCRRFEEERGPEAATLPVNHNVMQARGEVQVARYLRELLEQPLPTSEGREE
jgi:hypothetical protein